MSLETVGIVELNSHILNTEQCSDEVIFYLSVKISILSCRNPSTRRSCYLLQPGLLLRVSAKTTDRWILINNISTFQSHSLLLLTLLTPSMVICLCQTYIIVFVFLADIPASTLFIKYQINNFYNILKSINYLFVNYFLHRFT